MPRNDLCGACRKLPVREGAGTSAVLCEGCRQSATRLIAATSDRPGDTLVRGFAIASGMPVGNAFP